MWQETWCKGSPCQKSVDVCPVHIHAYMWDMYIVYVYQLKSTYETAHEPWTTLSFISTLLKCTHTTANTHRHSQSVWRLLVCETWWWETNMGCCSTVLSLRVGVSGVRQEENKQPTSVRSVMTMIGSQSFLTNPRIRLTQDNNQPLCLSQWISLRSTDNTPVTILLSAKMCKYADNESNCRIS